MSRQLRIPLQDLVPNLHLASCSIIAGGTCDCRSGAAEVSAPEVREVHADGSETCLHAGQATGLSEQSRKDFLLVFGPWDMSVAEDLRAGTIPPAARDAVMIVFARFAERLADIDPDFASLLVPEDCRRALLRSGLVDCPTRMMRIPEEEQ
jgi:hypothetical protein